MNACSDRPAGRRRVLATLPLLASPLLVLGAGTASAYEGDPAYTYVGAGYLWNDVNYAVKQDGGEHEGINIEGSLGLLQAGRIGVHLYGEFFDGDFATNTRIDGAEGGPFTAPDGDSRSFMIGAGASFALSDSTDLVGRAMYADTEVEIPDNNGALQRVSGDGYVLQALVRTMVGERVELEAGYRYTNISNSGSDDISNNDILLALTYNVTQQFAIRSRAIVFDDDTGIELGARWYFGRLIGRDEIF